MLERSIFREIRTSLGRYLAILAIIALGVGFFTGLKMCMPDMVDTADEYLQAHNFYDYEIMSSYGVDEGSVELAMNTEGVEDAELSMQKDIVIDVNDGDYEAVFKAISIPKKINTLKLVKGRMPKNNKECVVDNFNTVGTKIEIGQSIVLAEDNNQNDLDVFKYKKYKVVGTVNTPLYLDYDRGSTNLGSGNLQTFFYINRGAFTTDYDTSMYVKLKGNEVSFSPELKNNLEKYEKSMTALAKKVTAERKDAAMKLAEDILNEKRAELNAGRAKYNAGLAQYNREKASAARKIANGKNQILSGINTANQNEVQLRTLLADLQSKQIQVNNGLAQVEQKQASLDKQYLADEITVIEYEAVSGVLRNTKSELLDNKAQIEDGIRQINEGLEEIKKGRKEIDSGQKTLNKEEQRGKTELARAKAQLESGKRELERGEAALEAAEAQVAEMETGKHYALSRDNNTGYSSFENNAAIVSNVAKVFPLFFLLVAVLVCMTTMSRMIDEQRSQIGALRALGYTTVRIRNKYLTYSGSAALIGSAVGFFAGCAIFPITIWKAYTIMYDFNPNINMLHNWWLGIGATLVAMLCAMGATWSSCSGEFKLMPAALILPKAPPAGKRIFLERFTWLWDKMSFMYKVSFRNVFRYKKRFIMMVLGIAGCTALIVAGLGMKTSISGVGHAQYSEISKYDYIVAFNKDMKSDDQKSFKSAATKAAGDCGDIVFAHQGDVEVKIDSEYKDMTLSATNDKNIEKCMTLKFDKKKVELPGKGEVVLCRKMHDHYGLNVGDTIQIKDGYREMKATISGFYDNYIEETLFMTADTYEKGMGKRATINAALVKAPDQAKYSKISKQAVKLNNFDQVAMVMTSKSLADKVETMMKSMNAIVYVIILSAGLLAFIVVYNLTNINILERIREIATIKVLGFYNKETAQYVFRENVILSIISVIVGLPLGRLLTGFVIDNINFDMIFFRPRISSLDYAMAAVATIVFTLLINLSMRPKLAKISMAESLKTNE